MRTLNNKRVFGFTLIEVVVSMCVLSFGILGTVLYIFTSMRTNKESLERIDAAGASTQLVSRLVGGSISWTSLGSSANCGQAGTTNRACFINAVLNGQTYKLYYIICEKDSNLTDTYTGDYCSIPSANLISGPFPPELACKNDVLLTTDEKELRLMVVWSGSSGDCNHFETRQVAMNPDAV